MLTNQRDQSAKQSSTNRDWSILHRFNVKVSRRLLHTIVKYIPDKQGRIKTLEDDLVDAA